MDGEGGKGEAIPLPKSKVIREHKDREEEKEEEEKTAATKRVRRGGESREREKESGEGWGDTWKCKWSGSTGAQENTLSFVTFKQAELAPA